MKPVNNQKFKKTSIVYLPTYTTKNQLHVSKYTVRPMDGMGDVFCKHLKL